MNVLTRTTAISSLATVALVAGGIAVSAPAEAKSARVVVAAHCSTTHTVGKLKAHADNGRIEVEWEIDSNRNGQRWSWTLRHDGVLKSSGIRTTLAPSGSFSVDRFMTNATGIHRISATAKNLRTGETCTAALRY
jgi:hypothetical protein